MSNQTRPLKQEEILTLARQAKLMILDGRACYLNDRATEKELIAFVRFVEAALCQQMEDTALQNK